MKYSWELDKFDSEIFGFKVAKIKSWEKGNIKDLIKDFRKNKIKYATFRLESNNFKIIHTLEKSGFILVDGLISLSFKTSNMKEGEVSSEIRKATNNDLIELKELTSGLFLTGRIMSDPFIPRNKARQFYVRWIENSILGKAADSVLVWEEEGKILGYITLMKSGQIPLLGVSEKARGKGTGKKLISAALLKFKEWGVENIILETQIDNISALRLYQICGFKIVNSFLTLRWAEDD